MCPACFGAAAMVVAGGASIGGLVAFFAVSRRAPQGDALPSIPSHAEDDQDDHA